MLPVLARTRHPEGLVAVSDKGGYVYPVSWCGHREFVQSLIDLHVKREHPEEKRP